MFNKDVYSGRRATLKKMISKGIAFFPANNEAPFNYPDNTYIYRQDSNFSYYFGLNHPDLVGVIDFETGDEILFGVEVTIDDVTTLIDLLLTGNTAGNNNADVNADGQVTIEDATTLIDHLLTGDW